MQNQLISLQSIMAKRMTTWGFSLIPLHRPVADGCSCGNKACNHVGKHPDTLHGVLDATSDPEQIARWWPPHSEANIGVATGARSGVFVVDVDGAEGRATLKALMQGHQPVPDTAKVLTGHGEHYYLCCEGLQVGNGRLGPGIDLRGDGGYVVGMGSRHASGAMYRPAQYGRLSPRFRPAPVPQWLSEALAARAKPTLSSVPRKVEMDPVRYAEAALAGETDKVRSARPGTRNSTLNTAAYKIGQLVLSDGLDSTVACDHLLDAALQCGLAENEACATIRSGFLAGQNAPRAPAPVVASSHSVSGDPVAPIDPLAAELAALDETDVGNAQRLVRRFGDRLLCTPGQGYLVYDGSRWCRDDQLRRVGFGEQATALIAAEARYLDRETDRAGRARFSKASQSKSALDRMFDQARYRLMKEDSAFDSDPYRLNVNNGTIDLRTGVLHPHTAVDLLTKLAKIDYDATAQCPIFLSFLGRALREDAELIAFLQRAVGYSLTGCVTEQVFFFLFGPGSSGKSTFLNFLRNLLGDYGTHTPTETLLAKQYDSGIPTDLARLQGVRMVTAVEVNWNRQIDEARLKGMTGGDPITARYLRQNFFTYEPQFKLWMAANDLPGVRGTAEAFWRRARVVPFTVPVAGDEVDDALPVKLQAELPGILAWAVQGCLAWQREGLGAPEAVKQATAGWARKADHLVKFAADELVRDAGSVLGAHDCHERYVTWCTKHGETPLDPRGLKRGLEGLDYTHGRARSGSIWQGLKLRLAG